MIPDLALWREGDLIDDHYEVTRLLGQGGMGLVYQVRHLAWGADLAVKSPKTERWNDAGRKQFVTEAETWVSLGLHPHVCSCHYVRVLDGIPRVFAEYVSGGSLDDWIRDRRLYRGDHRGVLARILDLAIQCAWGLAHAHSRGVVHQDVKPANVLIEDVRGGAVTAKVTDFGIARARAVALAAAGDDSVPGMSIPVPAGGNTRRYASPEQVDGQPLGRRTDVYSYAVAVLEMFTGGATWLAGEVAGEALAQYRSQAAGIPPAEGSPAMPSNLADLLKRCLRHDPAHRPGSMSEIAAELAEIYHQTSGHPYPRRAPRASDLLADEENNRALSLLDLGRVAEAEDAFNEALSTDPRHLQATYNSGLLRWRRGDITDEEFITALDTIRADAGDSWQTSLALARVHLERGDILSARELLSNAVHKWPTEPEPRAALQAAQLAGSADDTRKMGWYAHQPGNALAPSFPISVTPDGQLALTGNLDGMLRLWDLRSGQCTLTIQGHDDGVPHVDMSADGRFALSATTMDKTVRLWDLADGSCVRAWQPDGFKGGMMIGTARLHVSEGIALVPISGGDYFSSNGCVQVWDVRSGQLRTTFDGLNWRAAAEVSPDGRCALISGYPDHTIRLWDLDTGQCRQVLTGGADVAVKRFSADGRFVITGEYFWAVPEGSRSGGGVIRIWDLDTGECLRVLTGHVSEVTALNVSPDNRFVLSGSTDNTARLWEFESGRCLRTLRGHKRDVEAVLLDTSTQTALTASSDNTIRQWNLPGQSVGPFQVSQPRQHAEMNRLADQVEALIRRAEQASAEGDYSSALKLLSRARATPGHERAPRVLAAWRRLSTFTERVGLRAVWSRNILTEHPCNVLSVALSADARTAATSGNDHHVRLWDVESGACLNTIKVIMGKVALSSDGSRLLFSSDSGEISAWSTETGERLIHLDGRETLGWGACSFSADGQHALVLGRDNWVRLWHLDSGELMQVLEGHRGQHVTTAWIDADVRTAVTGGNDMSVRLWDLGTGKCLHTMRGHRYGIKSVCLSADGRLIISSGEDDQSLRLWDASTGKCLRTFDTQARHTNAVRFSPDGRLALSADEDATVRLWNVDSGHCLRVLHGHQQRVIGAGFTPDGRFGLSWSIDAARLWEFDWDLAVQAVSGG
ncbi:protein kinase [Streptomyces sp. NPDC127172]|uniref:protein kinase domain-containing protein n=1 Tax=Streptomyces sp. NPDC127172 TaxID=3345382 RepID=UPI00362BD4E4